MNVNNHEIFSSYKCRFKHKNSRALKDTITYYTELCEYLKAPVLFAWNGIKDLKLTDGMKVIDELIHTTKQNPHPKYKDFDNKFYKCPCYLRRAAICNVIGHISSYYSHLEKWNNSDKSKKKPSLPKFKREFPVLYNKIMFRQKDNIYEAEIKVFYKNDWVWMPIQFRKSDIDYILHHCNNRTKLCSKLTYVNKKWSLTFSFKERRKKLPNTSITDCRILAVDLGINNPATCCVMDCNGTVSLRSFLKLTEDKDHLQFILNRIKRAQKHGSRRMPALWAKAKGINDTIARKTANYIIEQAVTNNVNVIVFEHLELTGKKKAKKQQLHHWKAKAVQQIVTEKAHRLGISISHINARNTSRLAFDGSGSVTRGTYIVDNEVHYNYSICVFQTGKTYNCDLNASYNIGARYFIRELLKPLQETVKSDILAKVPECSARSTCTLSSLINLNAVLQVSDNV